MKRKTGQNVLAAAIIIGLGYLAARTQGQLAPLPGSVVAVRKPDTGTTPIVLPPYIHSGMLPPPTRIDWTLPVGVAPAPGAPGSQENPYMGDIYGGLDKVIGGALSAEDIMSGAYSSTPNTGITYYTGVDYGSPEAAEAALAAYYRNFI